MDANDLKKAINLQLAPNVMYAWQMETIDGEVLTQYDKEGKEVSWKTLDIEKIIRCSFLPRVLGLPRHDIMIDLSAGERFIKRFGRGFVKQDNSKTEYVNCCMTNRYRVWIFSSDGRVIITKNDFELYINL